MTPPLRVNCALHPVSIPHPHYCEIPDDGGQIYFSSWRQGISVSQGGEGVMAKVAVSAGKSVGQPVTLQQAGFPLPPTTRSVSVAHDLSIENMITNSSGISGRFVPNSHAC